MADVFFYNHRIKKRSAATSLFDVRRRAFDVRCSFLLKFPDESLIPEYNNPQATKGFATLLTNGVGIYFYRGPDRRNGGTPIPRISDGRVQHQHLSGIDDGLHCHRPGDRPYRVSTQLLPDRGNHASIRIYILRPDERLSAVQIIQGAGSFTAISRCMNNRRLQRANSYIRARKERTENHSLLQGVRWYSATMRNREQPCYGAVLS